MNIVGEPPVWAPENVYSIVVSEGRHAGRPLRERIIKKDKIIPPD